MRGYSYENGIVKCPDEIVGIPFNVTELNNTTFTKVDRTMLENYRDNNNFENFTTSCTTNVTDMSEMFLDLGTFNHSISTWDTSSVEDMYKMFNGATSFNQDISNWTTSSVYDMGFMFSGATSFNQDISNWTTSSVEYMDYMFDTATSFNQDISIWDMSSVLYMFRMFFGATSFNQSISTWITSSVTDMSGMFQGATSFNQDISTWDMSSVNRLDFMFYNATSFNQSLTNWCVNGSFFNGTYTGIHGITNLNVTFYSTSHFSTHSPMIDAFQPLWNGAGCTYKCYNNGVRAIPYTENYSCICDPPFFGPYCINSYDEITRTVKCPHPTSVEESFFVPALNTTFTKVDRPMLNTYRDYNNFENFTTSCTTGVEDMSGMFTDKADFNSSISTWDTSSVTSMNYMFFRAWNFNSDISKWDTSSVISMYEMFSYAEKFNSDISKWDTSSVVNMLDMFYYASKFNQSLTNWCVRISEPNGFAIGSPIVNNPSFLPLWNGTGCTYKCYNGIRNTSDYSCTCNSGHFGPTCALTPDITITVTNKDNIAYHFNSSIGDNPTLNLATSTTYYFELGENSMTSHPFQLSYNNGTHVGTVLSTGVLLTTDSVAAQYTYKCTIHSAMTGTILSYELDTTSSSSSSSTTTTAEPVTTTTEPNTTSTPSIEEDSINVNLIIGLVSGGVVLVGSAFFIVYKCFFLKSTNGYTLTAM